MHEVGGAAGEAGGHSVADDLGAAGVEEEGYGDAGEKHAEGGAPCHAGSGAWRVAKHTQADDHHQPEEQGKVVQKRAGDDVGEQTSDEHGNSTGSGEIGGECNGKGRGHSPYVGAGEEQTGEKSAAALPEKTREEKRSAERLRIDVVHGRRSFLKSVEKR